MIKQIMLLAIIVTATTAAAQTERKMLGLGMQKKGDAIIVVSKVVGTPVMEATIYFGDTILAVNGASTAGKDIDEVVAAIGNAASDTIILKIRNNGTEDTLSVVRALVSEIKARKNAIIQQVIMKDISLPYKIPIFTNYGFAFELPKDDILFADDVEFLPGGLIKRTTKRNRQNFGNTETYEQTMYEILFPNLMRLDGDYNFSAFKTLHGAPDGTVYYEGTHTSAKISGSEKVYLFNNKAERLFVENAFKGTKLAGGAFTKPQQVGHHVFAVLQQGKFKKYALVYKDKIQLSDFEYEDVKYWDGPGAYVWRNGTWKIVVFEQVEGAGDGPWPFQDEKTKLWGYINKKGKVVEKPKFSRAGRFTEGLAAVQENGKWGFINPEMKWVIRPEFTGSGQFTDGIAPVQKQDGNWIYIGKDGRQALPGEFYYANSFEHAGSYALVMRNKNEAVVIDQLGNTILQFGEDAGKASIEYAAPGLYRVTLSKDLFYFKDLTEKTYLEYDYTKPRLANADDIILAKERKRANVQHEQERLARRATQEQSLSASNTATPTITHQTTKSCTRCNGAGYVTITGSKTINGKKYADSKVHYVDEYGIASKNYFTMKCTVCKGKGVVPK